MVALLRQYKDFQVAVLESWWVLELATSVENCFFNLQMLPLPSQNILTLLLFMIRNENQFQVNSEMQHIENRKHANFHQLSLNLTKYQKEYTI